ncbi:hypothetical protein G7054_g3307 [Neopestalotiopsis clavispora]|nr:hypothetical protein G7054_g3307 [Neopestalotiopsis clavispora]
MTQPSGDVFVLVEFAQQADIDAIAEIGIQSLPHSFNSHAPTPVTDFFIEQSFTKEAVARDFENPLHTTLVARTGSREVVGFAQVVRDRQCPSRPSDNGSKVTLNKLYVRPEARASGVGKKLMEAAEDMVKSEGHSAVWLLVFDHNMVARRLYARRGWKTTVPVDFEVCGVKFRDWCLEKDFY